MLPDHDSPNLSLAKSSEGIWMSGDSHQVDYPDEGNEGCMQLEERSFWFRHRNRVIIETLKRFSSEEIFYDVGGGNGFVAAGIQEAGFPVALVEPGIVGAQNAKKRGVEHVICSTLNGAKFQPESLPAVGIFDVLEHVEDHIGFLSEIWSYLKKDGHIFVTVPAYNWLWSEEDKYAGHHRRYTLFRLKEALHLSGFFVEYQTYFFWFLPAPILFFRTIPSLLWKRETGQLVQYQKEHNLASKGLGTRIVDYILNKELSAISKGYSIPFGGSCLVVAKKL